MDGPGYWAMTVGYTPDHRPHIVAAQFATHLFRTYQRKKDNLTKVATEWIDTTVAALLHQFYRDVALIPIE